MRSLLLVLLCGCITETGNPELEAELSVRASASDPAVAQLARTSAWRVDEAWVGLDEPRFVTAESCDTPDEVETDLPAPGDVDLVATTPTVVTGRLPADRFCRVRLRLAPADGGGVLGEDSVFLGGTLPDGRPFEVRSRLEREIDLRSRGEPFELSSASGRFVLAFDVSRWLADVEAAPIEADPDGVVRIDEDHDSDAIDVFVEALEHSLELFDDVDGDGEVGGSDVAIASP